MTRSCPESLNELPIFDVCQRKEHEKLSEKGSKLDPNSPCFYPSLFTTNHPIWHPRDMAREEALNTGDPFNNTRLPTNFNDGRSNAIPYVNGIRNGTVQTEGGNSFGYNTSQNRFGAVGRPSFNAARTGKFNSDGQGMSWLKPPTNERENYQIPSNNNSVPPKFGSFSMSLSDDDCTYSGKSTNQKFNPNCRERNVKPSSQGANVEAPQEIGMSNKTVPGVFLHARPRIVRNRQDTNKTWRNNNRTNSASIHCSCCKLDFKWPHVLSCLHSFCFSCIVKNFHQDLNQIKCPTCSSETEIRQNGLLDLDIDFTTCRILLRTNRTNPFSCMSCSQDKRATIFCQDCMKYICSSCQYGHETNATMSSHTMWDIKKITEYQGDLVEACSDHPDEMLEQYCEDCKQLVCHRCTSFGERHGTHVAGDLDRFYNSAVNKIRLMSNSMGDVRNEVQKRIQPLTILKQQIETSIRLCKQDIHKYSNSLLAETEKCRSQARLVIDKAHEDFTKDIDVAQDLMTQYTSEYSPLIDFFRRYLFSTNHQDFLLLAPSIQKKIDYMNEKHAEVQKHKGIFETNVSLKADFAGINEYIQNQYNSILITENLSDALPSDTTEMGRRIEKEVIASMGRSSNASSPRGSSDSEFKTSSCSPGSDDTDPQSEEFNYNRTAINFIHQFGNYGRGEYEFVEPSGVLYLLDGSLAICDTANHRIMVYDSQFRYIRTIGQPPNLPPLRDRKVAENRNDKYFTRTPSCLYFPYRIAQCPQTENIVVVERPPSRDIQIFTVLGKFINCFGSDILQHPRGVAVDEHGVIVTVEGRTMKLMLFSQDGQLLHRFFLSVHLEFPNDIAARDGLIYISDNRGHCVHVFDYNAEHKHTIGNESVTYYPIGVSLTHSNQVVVTDNHNTFNISVFSECQSDKRRRYAFGFKSKVRHANCYNVAVHPSRLELAVTSRENQVVIFNFDPLKQADDDKEKLIDQAKISFR